MGSLDEGTLCWYCAVREAGYIPDGCLGPLCMGRYDDDPGEGESCYDLSVRLGWDAVWERYTLRCYTAMVCMLCKASPSPFRHWQHALIATSVSRFMYRAEAMTVASTLRKQAEVINRGRRRGLRGIRLQELRGGDRGRGVHAMQNLAMTISLLEIEWEMLSGGRQDRFGHGVADRGADSSVDDRGADSSGTEAEASESIWSLSALD